MTSSKLKKFRQMNLALKLFLILLLSTSLKAQNHKVYMKLNSYPKTFTQLISKYYSKVNDTLYVSKCEISNFEYNEFLKKNGNYIELKPDSLKWVKYAKKYFYAYNYHWFIAYQDLPIVNVTYESAIKYCQWLSSKYASEANRAGKKILFKLPSEMEWLLACQIESNKKWPSYSKNSDSLYFKPNVKLCDSIDCITECSPDNVASKYITSNGCSHFIGNVSEMLNEKGESKGGSWMHTINESSPDRTQKYFEANPFTGFRVFLVIYNN